ncbi:nitroreductase family protein [Megamonas hypermegale]|uniref:nitroreductase family protein n=1 Tax=Megamonas hypermegale TaxID=158847 RepID=UPI0026F2FFEC|nr:nitroreductase family protein [Megamonas hypermegale]
MQDILNRTSVRRFLDRKIEQEKLKQILQAGFAAPSAKNTQPWEFLIVQNKETLAKMATFSPYAGPIGRAALGMLVCADTNCNPFIDYCEQDCAAATENMLIAAKKLGIGSCWIGVYSNSERVEPIRQYFSLPQNIVPLWMIAFGYPAETPKVKNKWNDAKIHYEKF